MRLTVVMAISIGGLLVYGVVSLRREPAAVTGTAAAAAARLGREPANPAAWCDLAEAFAAAGETEQARGCFARAQELGPRIPPVWVRSMNFHVERGEPEKALDASARALALAPDYDGVIFGTYDVLGIAPDRVMTRLSFDGKVARRYFQYLMEAGRVEDAKRNWKTLRDLEQVDDPMAEGFVNWLLAHRQPAEAVRVWAEHLGPEAGDYPQGNRLFNGGFERSFTRARLDWSVSAVEGIAAERDAATAYEGRHSFRVTFPGTQNFHYRGLVQTAAVTPGRWRLRAMAKSDGITTVSGPHLHVLGEGIDAKTEDLLGSNPWTPLAVEFTVPPGASSVTIVLCREPTHKFDSKIKGSVWVDAVVLTR